MEERRILMVVAHPDDEVIFGWPVLFDDSLDKRILVCSDDRDNPERTLQENREALAEISELFDIEARSLPYNCGFYSLASRNADFTLKDFASHILEETEGARAIFTHNSFGEYGHLDHQLIHSVLVHAYGGSIPIFTTDIYIETNWMPHKEVYLRGKHLRSVELDRELYEECVGIYRKHNAWTWDQPPVEQTGILRL